MILAFGGNDDKDKREEFLKYLDELYSEVRSIMLDKGISHEQAVQEFLDDLREKFPSNSEAIERVFNRYFYFPSSNSSTTTTTSI